MKIAVSGSNGYIAHNLIPELESSNHVVIRIERSELGDVDQLKKKLSDIDVVINLAGAPILKRWTVANKNEIIRSRIDSTQNIVHAINRLSTEHRPGLLISASAIGIYSPNKVHTEESTSFSDDFVAEVVKKWENASDDLNPDVRKVIFRIGLILGAEAKTIQSLVPIIKLGLGGKIGSGKQPFPFIHIGDAIRAILWSIENNHAKGIYNLVAPENIDNKTFTKTLAESLNRPAIFTVPEFVLKIALGEASALLLQSPQVLPQRLLNEGFKFNFHDIHSTIKEIIH
ncbi:TIGR01777 family oxidoreductase [bacterium]|nr:TIGR01777 family oxidoreductase [bacterium]